MTAMPAPRFEGLVPYVFVDDAERMLAWYSEVFGFVETQRWVEEGRIQNAEMRVGDTEVWIDGGGTRSFDSDGEPARPWIGVWVDDPDAMREQVDAAGVHAHGPEDKPYGVRMLTVSDPEGNSWGFMRKLAP